jgi:hypothetical protein
VTTKVKRRTWLRVLCVLVGLVLLLALGSAGYWKYKFPYGWSHCCAKGIGLALRQYALDHHGIYPTGGDTPEASLSMLYSNYLDAYTLRGKTVPLKVVQQALAKDGKLGPRSCGWNYVEGLTDADSPDIAIVWDKVGLGHNGDRIKGGGHEVVMLDGSTTYISAKRWPEFLDRQKQLLAQRTEREKKGQPALTARIRFPDGKLVDKYDGAFRLDEVTKSPNGEGSGSQSGTSVPLEWFRLYEEGSVTYQLTLPDVRLKSKPVTVTVSNSVASPDSIVFELESY